MQGRLYGVRDYPGAIVSSNPDERVVGEIYRLHNAVAMLSSLDEYEGAEYERVMVDAQLASGETTRAWVYLYRLPVDEAKRIKSGDFCLV